MRLFRAFEYGFVQGLVVTAASQVNRAWTDSAHLNISNKDREELYKIWVQLEDWAEKLGVKVLKATK